MIPKGYECREGNGIKLFIDKKSVYGLSSYEPMNEDDPRYPSYEKRKKLFDENPEWTFADYYTREETEKILHCLGCKAAKINNFKRYCCQCSDWYDFYSKEEQQNEI